MRRPSGEKRGSTKSPSSVPSGSERPLASTSVKREVVEPAR
jgi:hypothetical protein